MDAGLIATQLLSFCSSMLIKGGEEIFKGAGADLWKLIKGKFSSDREKQLLNEYVVSPSNERAIGKLELLLTDKLEEDEEFKGQVEKITKTLINFSTVSTSTVTQIHNGYGDIIGRDKNISK